MKKNTLLPIAFLCLCACSKSPAPAPADLVILGGKIITMEKTQPVVDALAARGQEIIAVGTEAEVRRLIAPSTEVLDLEGAVAYPGFYDAHAHFLGIGKAGMELKLGNVDSWQEIVEKVRAAAEQAQPGEWIEGRGWHQEKWEQAPEKAFEGLPRKESLDAVSPSNPVFLTHASGHMVMVNSRALELAGITAKTPDPAGGEIVRDGKGRLVGVLRENAIDLVRKIMPPEDSPELLMKRIRLATDECLSKGLTSFQDAGASLSQAGVYRRLAEEGKLRIRLNLMLMDSNEKLEGLLDEMRLIDGGDHYLTIRAIKRWLDGALGSHGAWMLEPYADLPSSTGMNTETIPDMQETARLAAEHGYQLCVHAIGDRANRETLDLYEAAFRDHPDLKDPRWRIEHAQHLTPEDLPRFTKLGVIASMQPTHCTSDGPWVPQRLGEPRAGEESYLWRSIIDSGAHLASGTDAPVEDVDPIPTFYSAVTRKMSNGRAFHPEQCMSREKALRSMTLEAAYASFQEQERGSLKVGKLADLTILTGNLLEIPEEEIPEVRVVATIVGGKIRYRSE